jgi:hypothetical protein
MSVSFSLFIDKHVTSLVEFWLWLEKGSYIVSGRWEVVGKELFMLKDRHDKEFVLSPVGKQTEASFIFKWQDLFSVQVLFTGQEIKRMIEYFWKW